MVPWGKRKSDCSQMTDPFLSIDCKPPALFDTTRMRTPGKHSNRKIEYIGKAQAKGGISLQQECSTIINKKSKRLAQVTKHAWGNAAYS